MLFGGEGHKTYLGCLNCNEFASDSVMNEVGRHGSTVHSDSIFDRVGRFGSVVSQDSACNIAASDPPVIVDGQGRFFGAPDRERLPSRANNKPDISAAGGLGV